MSAIHKRPIYDHNTIRKSCPFTEEVSFPISFVSYLIRAIVFIIPKENNGILRKIMINEIL